MPAYFRHALPLDAVKPIYLGEMIDPQPTSIAALIGKEGDSKDDPAADTETASATAAQA